MKLLCLLLVLVGCTKKYQNFHIIDKYKFNKEDPESPVAPKMLPTTKETRSHCEGQWFWTSNAKKTTDNYVNTVVRNMCDGENYLLNTELEEIWWTTIVYSRSCVRLEAYCPKIIRE